MKKKYSKHLLAVFALLFMAMQVSAQIVPTITGPTTVGDGITSGQIYSTEPGQTGYLWNVSLSGTITADDGNGTITVDWTNPLGNQTVMVTYNGAAQPATLVVFYYPFPPPIDPTTIPKFVDPMPHFAAGLRVDAKAGGNLIVKTNMVQQVALSTGTPMPGGRSIGDGLLPKAGLGNYAAYSISKDNGISFGPAMWPAQTIEAQQGNQLIVEFRNELYGIRYKDFNILADQTLMMNGYPINGNPNLEPYKGPIPMSVHLHGGEIPSDSDGGPTAWFMPGTSGPGVLQGPGFKHEASNVCTYPNQQEGTTLWYHPHDQGLTRINVYTGLAGYYFLRGTNEDALHLPGWSGDGLVQEATPTGRTTTFNAEPYLPEVELAIQDRMFNENGALYWPVSPTNPEINPYWTPEFNGDVMTVNGKSWPYLSVAPRKYAFRMLNGCNARFLNMWLTSNPDSPTPLMDGPDFKVISTEGGFHNTPVILDPAMGQTLFLAPAERPIVIIDFTGCVPGTTYTLMNDANAPYPSGDPIIPGLTDRIMQFVVNGIAVTPDNSQVPANLRPNNPMVQLTDFKGNSIGTPVKKRQLLLNEIIGPGGPVRVTINNSHFDEAMPAAGGPAYFASGPTEMPQEGTTELWQFLNTTADSHPIHPHLVQFQLVSRQPFDDVGYMAAYSAAWATQQPGIPVYPAGADYPGGGGTPFPYSTVNTDGFIGGNPPVKPFITGPVIPAFPEERGWKDAIKALPGHIETYIVRMAPTEVPVDAPPEQMVFSFDPSKGPGYVYHCHIIDHEDMDMMRPMLVQPAQVRLPNITTQPTNIQVCSGWPATLNVTATSINAISYQWEVSTNGGLAWTPLSNVAPYTNVTTAALTINPADIAYNLYQYHCVLTTVNGSATTIPVTLTVKQSPMPLLTGLTSVCPNTSQVYTTDAGMTAYVWAVSAGGTIKAGQGTNIVTVAWSPETLPGAQTVSVNYTNANGCSAPTPTVLNIIVLQSPVPLITGPNVVCPYTLQVYSTDIGKTNYVWKVSAGGSILSGIGKNSITVLWNAPGALPGAQTVSVNYSNTNGCSAINPTVLNITVNPLPSVTGPVVVCNGSTSTYTTQPGMKSYSWYVSFGGVIVSGGTSTSNTATIKWRFAGSQTVYVNYVNSSGCKSLLPTAYKVTVNPLPFVTINGPTYLSMSKTPTATYSTQAGMTGYNWKVTGGIIQTGQGSNSISVLWTSYYGNSVSVSYIGASGCASQVKTINIYVFKAEEVAVNEPAAMLSVAPVELKFEIYPVPNNGKFKAVISSPDEDTYSIQVFSAIGVKIHEVNDVRVSGVSSTDVDIRPVPPGMYSVVFVNSQNKVVRRILINR